MVILCLTICETAIFQADAPFYIPTSKKKKEEKKVPISVHPPQDFLLSIFFVIVTPVDINCLSLWLLFAFP